MRNGPDRLGLACYSQEPEGAHPAAPTPARCDHTAGRRSMNRFLKSAAFPILVVILLAYFAQQLILSKGSSTQSVGWSGFVQKLDQKNAIAKLKIDPTKNSVTYQLNDQRGSKFTTGYPGDIQLS